MCKVLITFAQNLKICAMSTVPSFNACVAESIRRNWHGDALTDYQGVTLQFKDVARKIEKLHILFEHAGLKRGDKIALCGRNSSNWAVAFLGVLSYGAVAVPVQNEFTPEQIHNIVNHSEAKLLFVGDVVVKSIDADAMPMLEGIINLPDFSIFHSRSERLDYARHHLNELFGKKYPNVFLPEHVNYFEDTGEELALINYTSGTTGFSKGVMLPFRTLWSNLAYCERMLGSRMAAGSNTLCILPMAHMYGMTVEFLYDFCHGCHIFFLTRLPSPALIAQAFADIHPSVVISVPLVVEKIIRAKVYPQVQYNRLRMLLNMPLVNKKVKQRICNLVKEAFGGNAFQVIVGGASLNQEIEHFLKSIDFPITVGYGTTECAPLISFCNHEDFVPGSCGTPVDRMEVKILSGDPENVPGEIVTRGMNVMTGYYKNPEATAEVLDPDGWYHTGDLGTMSADGHVFIRGRIKNMLLGSNGQNVYPEEIEDKLASMAMVSECLVVQRGQRLVGLVYPDYEEAKRMGFSEDELSQIMEQNRQDLNRQLPSFSRLYRIELQAQEFAKTPKKSIKRYLYQK